MVIEVSTKRFVVLDIDDVSDSHQSNQSYLYVYSDLNCVYTQRIFQECLKRRASYCKLLSSLNGLKNGQSLQFSDFENIEWEPVMRGDHMASSYLIRKGLSRKAQLSLQMKKYFSKNPSVYKQSFPFTIIIETWNAYEEMKIDFSPGISAAFDSSHFNHVTLRQRLEWSLDDVKFEFDHEECKDWIWILKPSVANKGVDISLILTWENLLDSLEAVPDMREWVLQRYISKPLLMSGHKFHLRVYILSVGALKVYLFEKILLLLAAHRYTNDDLSDIYSHLTNTARNAELADFDESKYVQLLDDLPAVLLTQHPDRYSTLLLAQQAVDTIRNQVRNITAALFSAYENEYTVFAPLSNCFELYGLDFLIDEELKVHFLEVNPGPDFKQTGNRLKTVIEELFEQTCQIVIDSNKNSDFYNSSNSHSNNEVNNDNSEVNNDRNESMQQQTSSSSSSSSPSASGHNIKDKLQPQQIQSNSSSITPTAMTTATRTTNDFSLVYDKEWSVSRMTGGFSFS